MKELFLKRIKENKISYICNLLAIISSSYLSLHYRQTDAHYARIWLAVVCITTAIATYNLTNDYHSAKDEYNQD